jgi:hypothetical protein
LPIGGAGGGTMGSLGTDMVSSLLTGRTRVPLDLFKRWWREEMLFSSSEPIAADGLGN